MIFTTQFNSENNKQKVVFNLAMITCIKDNDKCFIVEYLGNDCYIEKDANSQKLFDWLGAKTEKDMLSKQDLDSAVKNSMQQVQNLLSQIKK